MKRMNFAYLLGGLIILMVSAAIGQEVGLKDETRHLLLEPALILLILSGVWSLERGTNWTVAGGVIALAITCINYFWNLPQLLLLNLGIVFVFCLSSIWVASRHLLHSASIEVNEIIGAICVYLLLGLTWAIAYLFINVTIPQSFHNLTSTDLGSQLLELMYYSFITITTTGYGDIAPARPMARTVAYLEAITGQFYVAVLVAWLVGMYLSGKDKNR